MLETIHNQLGSFLWENEVCSIFLMNRKVVIQQTIFKFFFFQMIY